MLLRAEFNVCVTVHFGVGIYVCLCAHLLAYVCVLNEYTIAILLPRWEVVTSCWTARPKERPKFALLVNTLADLLDTDPTYIKLII